MSVVRLTVGAFLLAAVALAASAQGDADAPKPPVAASDWTAPEAKILAANEPASPEGGQDAPTQPSMPGSAAPPAPAEPPRPFNEANPTTPPVPGEESLRHEKIDLDKINLKIFERTLHEITAKQTGQPVRMSLDDCVRRTLEANQDIQVAEYDPLKSEADILASKGEFDPLLRGASTYLYSSQAAPSDIARFGGVSAIESFRTNSSVAVTGRLQWGTQYTANLGINKEETTFNKFIEEWSGGLTVSLTQPILRGRGRSANLARIRAAKNARLLAHEQLQLAVTSATAQVVRAYWDLVGAVEQLKVRQQALDNAERLLSINEKRLEIGTAAAIEIVQAQAGVASRQSDLITAHAQVRNAEDRLKQLMNLRDGARLSTDAIIPVDRPNLAEIAADETRSAALALEHRAEIKNAELAIGSAKIELVRANNDLLPELNVTGSVFQGARNHYVSNVFDGIKTREDNSYSIGVTGSVPIGNRTARGAHQRAELTVRQAEAQLEKLKQQALLDVRLAVRGVETSRILVESNRNARALQETNVIAEEKRLNLGVTTSYRVLQVQQDLTLAQTQEVQSLVELEKAVADLHTAEGTLLTSLGVEFEAPEPEKPLSFVKSVIPQQWR